ncbi:MAG: CopG family transcriptional regulator [Sulfurovum sp.]|nr:MAG: CopG family transcriptional regulator [Sulfurovum sp.]
MTKKMTITLEESLIAEIETMALESGKKKTQIIREALQEYFDMCAVTKTVTEYKMGTLKTLKHNDVRKSLGL